ncbi:hypothetical protein ES703_81568 [subsurface metagenome]
MPHRLPDWSEVPPPPFQAMFDGARKANAERCAECAKLKERLRILDEEIVALKQEIMDTRAFGREPEPFHRGLFPTVKGGSW